MKFKNFAAFETVLMVFALAFWAFSHDAGKEDLELVKAFQIKAFQILNGTLSPPLFSLFVAYLAFARRNNSFAKFDTNY